MRWIATAHLAVRCQGLDGASFASLCNTLLSALAARVGMDRTHLALNLNITEPDGGIDAQCRAAPRPIGRIVPAADVVYQFKGGGGRRSALEIARDDIAQKPRVVAALARGETLVYIAAADYGDEAIDRVMESLRNLGVRARADQIILISGETLAHELQAFPAVVAGFLGLDESLLSLQEWSQLPPMTNPFQANADLTARIAALRGQILVSHSMVRVVGAAGNGKTRTVLESLKDTELAGSVLYARSPDDISAPFWAYLRSTPDIHCTLVVDETDDATAANFSELFGITPAGVRLVMIGRDASGRAQPRTIQVEGLSEDLLVRAIAAIAPGLPAEAATEIAQVCERSPKFAVLIAERARDDPRLVEHHRRLADRQIQSVIDRYLPLEVADWNALSSVALLDHVGWRGELDKESVVLFNLVGLEPTDARRRVESLDEQYGIAPLAGRYRYVSPEILADHLAVRQLSAWPGDRVRELFTNLPPDMAASFSRRLRRLSAVLENREAVEEVILGDQGPFLTLADLEQGQLGVLLQELAGPFPLRSLQTIRRLINGASDDEIKAATGSRRHLVNALVELIWPEDTFEDAAILLLRLAANENETWANNATGLFAETFQTMLGRTAAGVESRVRVLRSAAGSGKPREREIAAHALGAAVKTGQLSRMGMPPRDVPGMPTREWRPATYGEWYDAIVNYLRVLAPLLQDSDMEVRVAAVQALSEATGVAAQVSRITDEWIAGARAVVGADYKLRAKLVDTLEFELKRERALTDNQSASEAERARFVEEQKARLVKMREIHSDLLGVDFSSRFRRAISRSPWLSGVTTFEEESRRTQESLAACAAEVVKKPSLLDGELNWLLQQQSTHPELFFELLGRADRERQQLTALMLLARHSDRAIGWVSLYEIGYAQTQEDPRYIDCRVEALRREGAPASLLFDLLLRAGYTPARVKVIEGLFRNGAVPGSSISSLVFSTWRKVLQPIEALELAAVAAKDAQASSGLVMFLGQYLDGADDQTREVFREFVLEVLARSRVGNEGSMFDHYWDKIAQIYAADSPLAVGTAMLNEISARQFHYQADRNKVLPRVWAAAGARKFFDAVLGPWLDKETLEAWYVRRALTHFPVHEVGVDYLAEWVAAKPGVRARALAEIIGHPVSQPTDLHAMLLEKYSDHGVSEAFFSNYISGVHMGPSSEWGRGKLEEATKMLSDKRPAIRKWAKAVIGDLERLIEREIVSEEEERFRR